MTPDEINRAIAESVGYQFVPCHDDGFGVATGERWLDPEGDIAFDIPNYHGDLNAIQEAVMSLSQEGVRSKYNQVLMDSLRPNEAFVLDRSINATAPQRCEAYLRTMNLWRDQ